MLLHVFSPLLETLVQGLDRHTIPYVVTGSPPGSSRAKPKKHEHIGVLVGVDTDRLHDILSLAAQAGWTPAVFAKPADFVVATSALVFAHGESRTFLTISFRRFEHDRDVINRAVTVRVGNTNVRCASAEDLVVG